MYDPDSSNENRLESLVSEALRLADEMGDTDLGIALNEALALLDGKGRERGDQAA